MATIKGKFIAGKVGPVIYKTYRGQQIIVSKAQTNYKIAEGTMKNATTFGKSSTFASQIRLNLPEVITNHYDGTMPYRLTQQVSHIVKNARDPETSEFYFGPSSFDALSGFQFNCKSPFSRSLLLPPYITVTDNQLTLHLPEINVPKDLKFPLKANSCSINFVVMEFDLLQGTKKKILVGETSIVNSKGIYPAQEWTAPLQEGHFAVIAMSLIYVKHTNAGNVVLNNKEFCPSMIIQAGFTSSMNQVGPFELTTKTYRTANNN